MSNVNKGKTGNVKVAGAIRSISTDNIAVYTGDVYDDNLQKNQRDINQEFFDEIAHTKEEMEHIVVGNLTAEAVKIADSNLYNVLGVKDTSTESISAVTPYIQIYNPSSNTFVSGMSNYEVEYGTRIIAENGSLYAKFIKGSSAGIDFNGADPMIRIAQSGTNDDYPATISDISSPGLGQQFTAKVLKSYHVDFNKSLTISLVDSNSNTSITTLKGIDTVTRTKNVNVVAQHLLTASHQPYVIAGPKITKTTEDYPSKSISGAITFKAFQYMFIHRTANKIPLESFGGTVGKTGYLARRRASKAAWTINTTSSEQQYYTIFVPDGTTLVNFYTTFLGNNSAVTFSLLGTVKLQGATSQAEAVYRVYQSSRPVAFGDGTMTFTFN